MKYEKPMMWIDGSDVADVITLSGVNAGDGEIVTCGDGSWNN